MVMQEEVRKGPWTEQEDFQLVCFVGLFGDRRWDFIAKVSGLNRTGKSCRLRWVNYLHPGLKRGKMTPQEERLVLELHKKWGNRWSRIARKLPGRTDNEIKNYWRTHTRKKAQEKKKSSSSSSSATSTTSPSSPSSSSTTTTTNSKSCSSSSNIIPVESLPFPDTTTGVESFYDTGGPVVSAPLKEKKTEKNNEKQEDDKAGGYYSMDDIWKEISLPEVNNIDHGQPFYGEEGYNNCNLSNSSMWDDQNCLVIDSLWKNMVDEEASKAFSPAATASCDGQFFSCFEFEGAYLTG